MKNNDYVIILIENYPCNSKDQLFSRERYWTNEIKCVNIHKNQGRCLELGWKKYKKEYNKENAIKIKDYLIEYNKENADTIKIKKKSKGNPKSKTQEFLYFF